MSANGGTSRYWDSCVFLGYLKKEFNRAEQCLPIIRAAESDETNIITSALTLAEVLWTGDRESINRSARASIKEFFDYSFIAVADLTRPIAENARELTWDYEEIGRFDAVHLATAMSLNTELMETYDKTLLEFDSRFRNSKDRLIRIREPNIRQ